ncbi:Uncharacterised protein [uncultured archaeon]|nr:Uncharacterised protein [uncultured archaeon]
MESSSDQISRREDVEEILSRLVDLLDQPVQVLAIGGAAMLEYGLNDATKNIDLVCKDKEDKARLLEAVSGLGFRIVGPEKRHARLGLDRVAVKGGHILDIFGGRISCDLGFIEAYSRAGSVEKKNHNSASFHPASPYHHYPQQVAAEEAVS